MENEYFVLSNTEELGFEGDDASLDNGYGSLIVHFKSSNNSPLFYFVDVEITSWILQI